MKPFTLSFQSLLDTINEMDTAKFVILLVFILIVLTVAIVLIVLLLKAFSRAASRLKEAKENRKTARMLSKAERKGKGKDQSDGYWIERLTEQYLKHPLAKEAAQNFTKHWIRVVQKAKRGEEIETVQCSGFSASLVASIPDTKEGICSIIYNTDLNFSNREIKPLRSKEEMYAFVRAIAKLSQENIKRSYLKDDSGSRYTLKLNEKTGRRCPYSTPEYFIEIEFAYSAPNHNYIRRR